MPAAYQLSDRPRCGKCRAIRARVTNPKLFKNGRHLSALIGTVPENGSTGVRQKGLSKKGDRYLSSLLITSAMDIVRQAKIRPDKRPWVTELLGRMSAKHAAIAIARNRLHAVLHGARLRPNRQSGRPQEPD